MIAQRIKNFFTINIQAKIVCTLLAVLLWVFVSSNQSLLGKFPTQIEIKPINLSENYQAYFDQEKVQVYAMAEPGVWKTLTSDSFKASVDLAGLKEGTYELDVKVISNVTNVQVTKVEPAKVFVTIEKIVSKNLAVTPKVDGDPAEGMSIGQVQITPQSVKVSGPSRILDQLSEANAIIQLNGESESFDREAKVVANAENSKELTGLIFEPATVLTKVSIIRGGNNKTVGVKVKTKGSAKENYFVSKITVSPSVVDIIGQRSILSDINYLETEEIDTTNSTTTISKDVVLILPQGVSLQKGVANKVHAEISFATAGSTSSVSPAMVPISLAPGLRVVSYTPALTVSLSGSEAALSTANSTNVRLEIDMSGRTAGSYTIDLTPGMIKVPDGIVVSGLSNSSLTFVISN